MMFFFAFSPPFVSFKLQACSTWYSEGDVVRTHSQKLLRNQVLMPVLHYGQAAKGP
jgi:hypothetical protein